VEKTNLGCRVFHENLHEDATRQIPAKVLLENLAIPKGPGERTLLPSFAWPSAQVPRQASLRREPVDPPIPSEETPDEPIITIR
jgi:hypothetical protein